VVDEQAAASLIFDPRVQSSLWDHMFNKCVVRLGPREQYRQRQETLKQLETDVAKGAYAPRPIHGYLSSPKGMGVARFIPVLSYQDFAVYFGCVRAFDEQLAELAVEDTYGGWSLGGKRRDFEAQHARASINSARSTPPMSEPVNDDLFDLGVSIPISSYNRWAWMENWCQYWKLLAAKFEHAPSDSCFAMLDVANFYDTIDLPRLIRAVRSQVRGSSLAIEVLSFFLSNWNRELNQYAPTTKGLPMDVVGDCSRVLANFYLTPFDATMRRLAQEREASFMRFADDMVLACPDQATCEELVFRASMELHRFGLNINVAKVRFLTSQDFHRWWGFAIMDSFEVEDQLLVGLEALRRLWDDEGYGRRHMALKRAISKLAQRPQLGEWQAWAYGVACSSEETLLELSESQMRNLLKIAPSLPDAIDCLVAAILKSPFTAPMACLLRCIEPYLAHRDQSVRTAAHQVVESIRKVNDPVLNLALDTIPHRAIPAPSRKTAASSARSKPIDEVPNSEQLWFDEALPLDLSQLPPLEPTAGSVTQQ